MAGGIPNLAGLPARVLHWAGILAGIPALVVLVCVDVLLRYGFNAPLVWGNDVSTLLLLVVFFASLPQCSAEGGHIRMELLYNRLGRRGRHAADALSVLCGLIFAAVLTYQAFTSSAEMFRYGEGAEMIDIPYWPFALFMGLCGGILSLRFAAGFLRHLSGCARRGGR